MLGWAHGIGGWGGGWHSCESIHQLSYFLPSFCMDCSTCSYHFLFTAGLHDSRQYSSMNKPDLLESSRVGRVLSYRFSFFLIVC